MGGVTVVSGVSNPGDVTTISGMSIIHTGVVLVDFNGPTPPSGDNYYFAFLTPNLGVGAFGNANPDGTYTTFEYDTSTPGTFTYRLITNAADGSIASAKTIDTAFFNNTAKDTSNNIYNINGNLNKLTSSYSPVSTVAPNGAPPGFYTPVCGQVYGTGLNSIGIDSSGNLWINAVPNAYWPCCCHCYCLPTIPNYASTIDKFNTSLSPVNVYYVPFNPWTCTIPPACCGGYLSISPYYTTSGFVTSYTGSAYSTYQIFSLNVTIQNSYTCNISYEQVQEIIVWQPSVNTNITRYLFRSSLTSAWGSSYFVQLRDLKRNPVTGTGIALITCPNYATNLLPIWEIVPGSGPVLRTGFLFKDTLGLSGAGIAQAQITCDSSGNIYILINVLDSQGTDLGFKIYIAKLNSSFVLQWQRVLSLTSPALDSTSGISYSVFDISSSTSKPGLAITGSISYPIGGNNYAGSPPFVMTVPFDGSLTQTFSIVGNSTTFTLSYAVASSARMQTVSAAASVYASTYTSALTAGSLPMTSATTPTVTPASGYSSTVKIL